MLFSEKLFSSMLLSAEDVSLLGSGGITDGSVFAVTVSGCCVSSEYCALPVGMAVCAAIISIDASIPEFESLIAAQKSPEHTSISDNVQRKNLLSRFFAPISYTCLIVIVLLFLLNLMPEESAL